MVTAENELPWHYDGPTLTVETPEQAHVEFRIAPFGTRLMAALIDRVILTAIVAALAVGTLLMLAGARYDVRAFAGVMLGVAFLIFQLYFVSAELRNEGRTWGKKVMGLRTVHESGRGIDLQASLIRNLARIADEIPITWILPLVNRGTQRIGDLMAGTYVILDERNAPSGTWLDQPGVDYEDLADKEFPLPPSAAALLVAEDLNLVEYLGARTAGLTNKLRKETLAEVAQRYAHRLGLDDRIDRIVDRPHRFLLELGLQLRQRFDTID